MTFDRFCIDMWLENCIERDALGDPLLKRAEYIELNKEFLKNKYAIYWGWGKKILYPSFIFCTFEPIKVYYAKVK